MTITLIWLVIFAIGGIATIHFHRLESKALDKAFEQKRLAHERIRIAPRQFAYSLLESLNTVSLVRHQREIKAGRDPWKLYSEEIQYLMQEDDGENL